MQTLTLSFEIGEKMLTLKRELKPGEDAAAAVSRLLQEVEGVEDPGKATAAQLRALYARASAAGWSKEQVKEYLEEKLGTSLPAEIVGTADRREFSRLINQVYAPEVPGKATASQMRVLWAKALSKGWDRDRVRGFLEEKVGAGRDEKIIGCVDQALVASAIRALKAA